MAHTTRRKRTTRKPSKKPLRYRLRSLAPWRVKLAELDQSRLDAIALGLVGLGLFLGYMLYFGYEGGRVGEALSDALAFLLGAVSYAVPPALVASGGVLLKRDLLAAQARIRLGGTLLLCALCLGFAAGTLGLGPSAPRDSQLFNPDRFMDAGGLFGEALYWATSSLLSSAGAHLTFFVLFAAGLLLVTGTSVGSVAAALRRVAGDGGRALMGGARSLADRLAAERERAERDAYGVEYDEPQGEPSVRALGGAETPEDDFDDEPGAVAAEDEALDRDEEGLDPLRGVEREVEAARSRGALGDDDLDPGPAIEDEPDTAELTPMGLRRSSVTESQELRYRLPEPTLLRRSGGRAAPDSSNQDQVAELLVETLGHFGIDAQLVGRVTGPRVTRHELRLAPGTKVSKVTQLKDDLAYALASTDIRILAPIPGKQAVGVEVPNKRHRMVFLGDIFERELADGAKPRKGSRALEAPLAVWLGKDIAGHSVWTDLARMPHVLVAGTTGSGKSGCVNAMLSSILLRSTPNEVRMVLVDPKRVELNHYDDIPHLLTPVVTVPRMAANVLANLIREMECRYEVMQEARARNIMELNKARRGTGEPPLPHILCVIDELADLMMVAPAEVEDSIIRLAQKSRAVGIHLVLATQRPSVDIITGTIKVNVPARIAFAVSSQHDSRVILDQGGAEALLGQGDMLFRPVGSSKLQRIQGAYITEEEIARLTAHWRSQGEPAYEQELLEAEDSGEDAEQELSPDEDDLLEDAIHLVAQTQTASVSMLQRRLRVGYTRAGRLIDMLERRGVISGYEGSKPRQVLVTEADVSRVLAAGASGERIEQPMGARGAEPPR